MEKELIRDEKDLENFKAQFGPHAKPSTRLNFGIEFLPKEYPCVVVWYEWDNPNGPFEITADFVYLSDFKNWKY